MTEQTGIDKIFENKFSYFSSSDTIIKINDIRSDEVSDIQFSYVAKHVPIFGYRSFIFDAAPLSKSLVTGSITINYVANGYFAGLLTKAYTKVSNSKNKEGQQSNQKKGNIDNFFEMNDSELETYRNVQMENTKEDFVGKDVSDTLKVLRPENILGPFNIELIDNSRFAETDDEKIENNITNGYSQKIIIKDVYIDTLTRARSVSLGVIKDAYSFIAKTLI